MENEASATGKLDSEELAEEAFPHAHQTALVLVTAAKSPPEPFDPVKRVRHFFGKVNKIPAVANIAKSIDVGSCLLRHVCGNRGRCFRTAGGMESLSGSSAKEIEVFVSSSPAWRRH